MDNTIRISVIIPVYNTEEFLGACLDTLFLQKYRDVEFVLVDDGSTDGSRALCEKYAAKDSRFVVISKENGGPSSARNLGIEKARGEYITFVDSDDFVDVCAYEKIAALLDNHDDPDVLVFGANLVPDFAPEYLYRMVNTRDMVYDSFTPEVLFEEVGARPFLWLQVVKRSLLMDNNIKMDETIDIGEDQVFQIEFFPCASKIVFASDKLYFYRWRRDNSIMNKYGNKYDEKLLAHIGVIDRAFGTLEARGREQTLGAAMVQWSVYFMWWDLVNLGEYMQSKIACALVNVLEKHNYRKYYDKMHIWAKSRLDQILLMAVSDRDAKFEGYHDAISKLESEIESIKALPEYPAIERDIAKKNKKRNPVVRLFACLRENGFKYTVHKVIEKLKTKFGRKL